MWRPDRSASRDPTGVTSPSGHSSSTRPLSSLMTQRRTGLARRSGDIRRAYHQLEVLDGAPVLTYTDPEPSRASELTHGQLELGASTVITGVQVDRLLTESPGRHVTVED